MLKLRERKLAPPLRHPGGMRRTLGCLGVLVLTVSLLLFARPAEAAISLQNTTAGSSKGTTGTTLALSPPGEPVVVGDLAVFLFVDRVGGNPPAIGDNLLNTGPHVGVVLVYHQPGLHDRDRHLRII